MGPEPISRHSGYSLTEIHGGGGWLITDERSDEVVCTCGDYDAAEHVVDLLASYRRVQDAIAAVDKAADEHAAAVHGLCALYGLECVPDYDPDFEIEEVDE